MSEITPNTPNPVREDAYKNELATKLGIDPQYIPESPVWRNEEEIAALAEMFANMSGGSGGGVLVVNISQKNDAKSGDTKGPVTVPFVCDKTAGEMWAALQNGNGLLFYIEAYSEFDTLKYAAIEDGVYGFVVITSGSNMTFTADSASGYPATA
jgi:hypothetical protein